MMYSGSSYSTSSETNPRHHPHHQSLNSLSHQNEGPDEAAVMSMKKSAEIAAVFSGAKINQMTDIVDHNLSTDTEDFQEVSRYRQQYSESNMHSSLGYFP